MSPAPDIPAATTTASTMPGTSSTTSRPTTSSPKIATGPPNPSDSGPAIPPATGAIGPWRTLRRTALSAAASVPEIGRGMAGRVRPRHHAISQARTAISVSRRVGSVTGRTVIAASSVIRGRAALSENAPVPDAKARTAGGKASDAACRRMHGRHAIHGPDHPLQSGGPPESRRKKTGHVSRFSPTLHRAVTGSCSPSCSSSETTSCIRKDQK